MYVNESLLTAAKCFTIMNERAKLVGNAHQRIKKRTPSFVERSIGTTLVFLFHYIVIFNYIYHCTININKLYWKIGWPRYRYLLGPHGLYQGHTICQLYEFIVLSLCIIISFYY